MTLVPRARVAMLLATILVLQAAPTTPAVAAAVRDGRVTTVVDPVASPVADKALAPHAEGTVIVGFRPGTAATERAAARAAVGATASERLSPLARDVEVLRLAQGRSVEAAIAALASNPNVRFAEPDYLVTVAATSNDPSFLNGSLWGMYGDASSPANAFGSQAAEAWALDNIGSSSVHVVVIDEGLQTTHPDLAGNVWTNPFETAGNGIDDDGNGYVDDMNGWDFVSGDASVYDGSGDDHGTHVAGTIGAVGGNGIGVAGVAWDVTMISAKFLGSSGGTTTNAVRAVDYATGLKTRHGLNIVATSNSWGGGGFSQALLDAINRGGDAGILFVAAAGNSSANNDAGTYYPSGYECTRTASGATRGWDCVVAVASITSSGALSSFSSYGATTVDLGAPGSSVLSTLPGGTYGSYSGTSMATPHVSGAIALCAAMDPSLTPASRRSAVVSSTAPTASLAGKTVSGGRLDVGSMAASCRGATAVVGGAPSGLTATASEQTSIGLAWSMSGVTNASNVEIQRGTSTCTSFATVAVVGASSTSTTVTGLDPSTTSCFRVRATNGFGGGTQSAWSNTATATTLPPPDPYVCAPTSLAWIDATSGGTLRTLGDDAAVTVGIGFPFRFYGKDESSVRVSSNGFIALGTSQTAAEPNNAPIPTSGAPEGIAAAFWDDLNPGVAGQVWTRTVGSTVGSRQFVASWIDVPHYSFSGTVTVQVVLDEATGAITFNHLDTVFGSSTYDQGRSATVGVESGTGRDGTQVAYNQATVVSGTATRCATAEVVAPKEASVASVGVTVSTTSRGSVGTATVNVVDTATGQPAPSMTVSGVWTLVGTSSTATVSGATGTAGSVSFTSPRWSASNGQVFRFCVTGLSGVGYATSTPSSCAERVVAPPLAVSTSTLPGGSLDADYAQTLAATGGAAPYTWSLAPGSSLPAGLTLSTSGTISGRPTVAGSTTFTVVVSDAGSPALTAQRSLSIGVRDPSVVPATVSSVAVTTSTNRKGTTGSALVTLAAAPGGSASSVLVSGVWTIDGVAGSTSASGTTGSDGTVTIASPRYATFTAGTTLRFCVTSLTVSGVAYPLATPVCGSRTQ